MITIVQAHNTNEVVEHVKPDVAVTWVNNTLRSIDAFSRTMLDNYTAFTSASQNVPADHREIFAGRRKHTGFGYVKTDRVYIVAVAGRANAQLNVIQPRAIDITLSTIARTMRESGLKSITLPLISTGRNVGLGTISYLEMLDRIFYDMEVFLATAVPLATHNYKYVDITNTYQARPKIEVKRRPAVPTHGWGENPYGYQASSC